MISIETMNQLAEMLLRMPVLWDGRQAVLEMKKVSYAHWKQMEWIGFYFQFLCEAHLTLFMSIPGAKYDRVEFDGFLEVPWDFKVHPNRDARDQENKSIIINDRLAIDAAIEEFGAVGLLLASGNAIYDDEDRSFQTWHQQLKGGLSNFEKERIRRKAPSRLRKVAFTLDKIDIILLDDVVVKNLHSFQQGFRNSDGSSRNAKVLLDMNAVTPVKTITFNA